MSNTARKPLLLLFGFLAIAAPALAGGPSLIRYPYKAGDHLPAVSPWEPDKILVFLDREDETLAHMAILSRIESSKVRDSFLDVLKRRADDARTASEEAPSDASLKREAARRLFDYGFAGITCGDSCNPSREPCFKMFEGSVWALGDDAAAWLALARAVHPEMQSGNLKEHARAFVKAYDLTQALPEGVPRTHLIETLQYDLETLEGYLDEKLKEAKRTPSPAERFAYLKKLAQDRR